MDLTIPSKPLDFSDVEGTVHSLQLAAAYPDLKLEHCPQLHAVASATIELAKLAAKRWKAGDETAAMVRDSKVAQLLIKRRWGLLINEAEKDNRTRVRGLATDLGIHATELIRLRNIGQMQDDVWAQVVSLQTSLAKAYSLTVEQEQSPPREQTQVEKLKAETQRLREKVKELTAANEHAVESYNALAEQHNETVNELRAERLELARLQAIVDGDDRAAAANSQMKQMKARLDQLEEHSRGRDNTLAEYTRMLKRYKDAERRAAKVKLEVVK